MQHKRNRKKIHLTLEREFLVQIASISTKLYISKGLILDDLIRYILNKHVTYKSYKPKNRVKLTTTINPDLWNEFRKYANSQNFKYNQLLESALPVQLKNYRRKINYAKK